MTTPKNCAVVSLIKKGNLEDIIDPGLKGKINLDSLRKFAGIAHKCVADHDVDHTSMSDVLLMLKYTSVEGESEWRETCNQRQGKRCFTSSHKHRRELDDE
ncbi:putative receptor-like protein kinase, partial [Mucuna pruriens]